MIKEKGILENKNKNNNIKQLNNTQNCQCGYMQAIESD